MPQNAGALCDAHTLEGAKQIDRRRARSPRKSPSRCSAQTAAASSTPTPRIPSRTRPRSSNFVKMISIFAIGAASDHTLRAHGGRSAEQGWAILGAMACCFIVGVACSRYGAETAGHRPGSMRSALQPAATWRARRSASASPPPRSLRRHHHRRVLRRRQRHARQLHAARRPGADRQHAARRDHLRRRRLRPLRHAAVRDPLRLHRRPHGRAHAGISRQEDRSAAKSRWPCSPSWSCRSIVPRLYGGCRVISGGASQDVANNGTARLLRDSLRLHVADTANNGSAFGGHHGNTLFYNITGAVAMLIGRFAMIVPVLAIAGSLVAKKLVPASAGTFPTDGRPLRRSAASASS